MQRTTKQSIKTQNWSKILQKNKQRRYLITRNGILPPVPRHKTTKERDKSESVPEVATIWLEAIRTYCTDRNATRSTNCDGTLSPHKKYQNLICKQNEMNMSATAALETSIEQMQRRSSMRDPHYTNEPSWPSLGLSALHVALNDSTGAIDFPSIEWSFDDSQNVRQEPSRDHVQDRNNGLIRCKSYTNLFTCCAASS